MSTLERAIEIAARAHSGQLDKADQPYIFHPLRVMFACTTLEEQITAILHDVVEDTTWTIQELSNEGFSSVVIEAVLALTKLHGESRADAARRTRINPKAKNVKIADVTDNMNLQRISNPTHKDMSRVEQYKEVLLILKGEVD